MDWECTESLCLAGFKHRWLCHGRCRNLWRLLTHWTSVCLVFSGGKTNDLNMFVKTAVTLKLILSVIVLIVPCFLWGYKSETNLERKMYTLVDQSNHFKSNLWREWMSNYSEKYLTRVPLFNEIPPLILKPFLTADMSDAKAWVIRGHGDDIF